MCRSFVARGNPKGITGLAAVIREQYFLACNVKALDSPMIAAAQQVMESSEFKATLAALPGYDGALCGTHVKMEF